MSNDVKWTDWRSSVGVAEARVTPDTATVRMAWLQLIGCVIGLALLAAGLPGPRSLVGVLTGSTNPVTDAALLASTGQAAILATAGLVVWVLLIWSVAVCGAATVGLLPGAPGLIGRSVLRRIAPAAAGRLVAAAVGVSLLAGASACAAPAMATAGAGSSTEAVGGHVPSTASVPEGDGSRVVDPAVSAGSIIASTPTTPTSAGEVIASIVIDWPDAGPTVSLETGTPSPTSSSTPASSAAQNITPAPAPAPADPSPGGGTEGPTAAPLTDATTAATTPIEPSTTEPSTTDQPPGTAEPPAKSDSQPQPPSGNAGADAPEPPATPGTIAPQPPSDERPDSVTVRGGDSLWSIAANRLPPDATDADIDTAWRAWYFANEDVIGNDPDLIQPGQHLLPPTTK